jgi:hypothetical protein
MVEEDGYAHGKWLRGWLCALWMVKEDGYVHDGWLKRMVMSMMDG